MTVAQELKELIKIEPRVAETTTQYALRLAKSADRTSDEDWSTLSTQAQTWVNAAIRANLEKGVFPMLENSVAKELKEITGLKPQVGEIASQFVLRLLTESDQLVDQEWNTLSIAAQTWVNIAIEANLNKEEVPMPEGIDAIFHLGVAEVRSDVVVEPEAVEVLTGEASENTDGSLTAVGTDESNEPLNVKDTKVVKKRSPGKVGVKAIVPTITPAKGLPQNSVVDAVRARVLFLQGMLVEAENKLTQIEAAAHVLQKLSEEFLGEVSVTPTKTSVAAVRGSKEPSGEVPKTQRELVLGVLQKGPLKGVPAVADAIYKLYGISIDKKSLAPLISGMLSKKAVKRTEGGLLLTL